MLTTRSAKNSYLVVQLVRRLNILHGWPRVLEDCLSSKCSYVHRSNILFVFDYNWLIMVISLTTKNFQFRGSVQIAGKYACNVAVLWLDWYILSIGCVLSFQFYNKIELNWIEIAPVERVETYQQSVSKRQKTNVGLFGKDTLQFDIYPWFTHVCVFVSWQKCVMLHLFDCLVRMWCVRGACRCGRV